MPARVTYALYLDRQASDRGWVSVRLRRQWWMPVDGLTSRLVATTGFYAQGMAEHDVLESALREMLRTLADEGYR